jgi:hypothetical protein
MKLFSLLAPVLWFALPTFSLEILLPLYVYPGTSASAWSAVFSAVSTYSSVQWKIIINPASGPGSGSSPDANYVYGINQLNGYSNVQTLGYVDTSYTTRAYASVQADIDTYAGWADYEGADIGMRGIFFDQATTATTTAAYTYMENAADYAYDTIPREVTWVVFNPGTLSPTQYFDYADFIVEYEGAYSGYSSPTTVASFPDGYQTQCSILIHDTPDPESAIPSLISTMKSNHVGSVYFTYDCCYNSLSGTLLAQIASSI